MTTLQPPPPPAVEMPAAPRRSFAKKLLRLVITLAVAGAVALGCLIGYAQTNHAFKRVILPIIARTTGARITADSGSISLRGKLRARGLKYSDGMGGKVTAKEVYLAVAPGSLAGGSPRITDLLIDTADVTQPMRPAADADAEAEAEPDAKTKAEPKKDAPAKKQAAHAKPAGGSTKRADRPYLPVSIDRARIVNSSVTLTEGDRDGAVFKDLNLSVDKLAPGSKANIKAEGSFRLSPADPKARRAGSLELDLEIDQGARGTELSWTGTGVAKVKEGPDLGGGVKVENLALDMKTDGSLKGLESAHSSIELNASLPEGAAGRVKGAMEWTADGGFVESSLVLSEITRELPNLFLAATGPAQFESARFDGALKSSRDAKTGAYRVSSTFTGKGLSLRPEPGKPSTPKVDFSSDQAAVLNPDDKTARIETFDVKLVRGGTEVARAALAEPATIQFGSGSETSSAADAAPEKTALALDINSMSVDDLRPWFALANNDSLAKVEEGRFEGKLTVNVAERGRRLDLKGRVKANGVRLAAEEKQKPLPSFDVDQTLDVSSLDMKKIDIRSAEVALAADGRSVGAARVAGSVGLEKGAMNLSLDLTSADVIAALERLGGKFEGAVKPGGGALEAAFKVKRADADAPVSIAGHADVKGFQITRDGRSIKRNAAAKLDVEFDPAKGRVTLDKSRVDLTDASGAAGSLDIDADWPAGAGEGARPGTANLKLRGLEGKPWLDFFQVMTDQAIERAPIEADLKITSAEGGKRLTIAGEERVGPLRLGGGDVPAEDVTMKVRQEFEKIGDDISEFVVAYTADRKGGKPDQLEARGSAKLGGDVPDIKADITVASFAPQLYLGKSESAPRAEAKEPKDDKSGKSDKNFKDEKNAKAAEPPKEKAAPKSGSKRGGTEKPPIRINGGLNVAELRWGDLKASSIGKLQTKGDTLRWTADSISLAEGEIAGDASMKWSPDGDAYAWNLKGNAINAATLVGSFKPDLAGKITGKAAFETQGRGPLGGENPKRDLAGDLTFDLKDGKLMESSLLNQIADATGSELFREINFTTFHGEVDLGEGKADIKEARVLGPVVLLRARGAVDLDGPLDMKVSPGIAQNMSGRLSGNKYFQQYGSILTNQDGYVMFPLAVKVGGTTAKPKYGVVLDLPSADELLKGAIGEKLEGALDSLIGGKKKKKKSGEADPVATATPAEGDPAAGAPTAEPTPRSREQSIEDKLKDAIGGDGGLLGKNGALKKFQRK